MILRVKFCNLKGLKKIIQIEEQVSESFSKKEEPTLMHFTYLGLFFSFNYTEFNTETFSYIHVFESNLVFNNTKELNYVFDNLIETLDSKKIKYKILK